MIVYKATHNFATTHILIFFFRFHFSNILIYYNTRSAPTNLFLQPTRTQLRFSTLSSTGPRIWNSLPQHLNLLPTISRFKLELTTWFITQYVAWFLSVIILVIFMTLLCVFIMLVSIQLFIHSIASALSLLHTGFRLLTNLILLYPIYHK